MIQNLLIWLIHHTPSFTDKSLHTHKHTHTTFINKSLHTRTHIFHWQIIAHANTSLIKKSLHTPTHLSLTNYCACTHLSLTNYTHTHSFHGQIIAHTHTHLSLTNHCTHTHTHFKLKTNLLQPIRWWCGQELQDWCRALHCCHCTPATQSWMITTSVTVTRSSCTHTHARKYTCTHTHTYACTHTHTHMHAHTHTHICMHTHTHTYAHTHMPHSSSDRLELFMGPCPINSRA